MGKLIHTSSVMANWNIQLLKVWDDLGMNVSVDGQMQKEIDSILDTKKTYSFQELKF